MSFLHRKHPQQADFQSLVNTVQDVVEHEARTALKQSRATQRLVREGDDPTILLEPQDPMAAPLEISFDTEYLVNCFPGRNGMICEVFSKSRDEICTQVRDLVRAVIGGRYFERVKDGAQRTKIVAEWPGSDGPEVSSLNVLRTPRPGAANWTTVTYRPY